MKKMPSFVILTLSALILAGCSGASLNLNPKSLACRKACSETQEQCEAKAGDNLASKAACNATYNKCVDKCSNL